jgi:hypothetical protein
MEDHESSNESQSEAGQAEVRAADRRAFMKSAVKTVVAGTAVVGIAGSVGRAEAATASCGGSLVAPKAVVKAHVVFNNQAPVKRQDIINVIGGIFDGSVCAACGLGGYPGPFDPGTVIEITLGTAFLQSDQLSSVLFTDAGGAKF